MDTPRHYEIQIKGYLTEQWSDWFEGLTLRHTAHGETTLSGMFIDQAALIGVLNKIHALNLILIAVSRSGEQKTTE